MNCSIDGGSDLDYAPCSRYRERGGARVLRHAQSTGSHCAATKSHLYPRAGARRGVAPANKC